MNKKDWYKVNPKYIFAHDPSMTGWGWVVMDLNGKIAIVNTKTLKINSPLKKPNIDPPI